MKKEELPQATIATKYFVDKFSLDLISGGVSPTNKKEELAFLYFNKFMETLSAFDRLIKYEKYFKDFFPPKESGISESEVIEYHLRSYLEDFYILQERVRCITIKKGLREDVKYYNVKNIDEVKRALKHINDQIHSNFKKITSELRRKNVHEQSITEMGLVKGKLLDLLIKNEVPTPKNIHLDKEVLKNEHEKVVISMKNKYIKNAANNNKSLKEMKEWFATRFIHVFSLLNGHDIEGLKF